MKRLWPLAFAPLLLGAAGGAGGDLGWAAPYLQNGTPGAVTLVWRDPAPKATVDFEPLPGYIGFRRHLEVDGGGRGVQQEVTVRGLTPGARYRWTVAAGGSRWEGQVLVNRPRRAEHARFAAIGDIGTGAAGELATADRLTAWSPEFVLAAGDLVYPDGAAADYRAHFFLPFEKLLMTAPLYPVLGNHDVRSDDGAPFLAAFATPIEPGGERYYAFDHGPARFYALDSTQRLAPDTMQGEWLAADAGSTDARWKIAFFHHPPFSSGLHGGSDQLRREMAPLFSRLGFDLVICGHDHHYERFKPQGGVTYVVTGGGGGILYKARGNAQTAAVANEHHFLGLTIAGDWLGMQAIAADGRVLDAAAIRRRVATPMYAGR